MRCTSCARIVRPLRSVLAAYEPVFDAAPVVVLRRRYGELGDELGVVRDIEVRVLVAERALDEASEQGLLSDAAQAGSARARLIDAERENYRLAHARFVERQRLPRAARAPRRARGVPRRSAAHPARRRPGPEGDRGAASTMRPTAPLRRAERAHGADDTEALHDLRKAGRRLRYAAEAVRPSPVELFDGRIRSAGRGGRRPTRRARRSPRRGAVRPARATRGGARRATRAARPLVFEQLAVAADERAAAHLR